ncbi:GTPase HflX [Cellulosilyticum sp. I15G10I2]|uniref:GTPase HflX n=1 Tax=Cellulosilyticum sp. I15G10I2 TaxID=1892843 RepID=UPI00085C3F12|nr:GTPase HflX [Cellulosilyticum sp. I15G10I2]
MDQIEKKQERLILVSAQKKQYDERDAWESLDELEELVETAGGIVITKILQRVDHINSAFYVGTGKAEEIKEIALSNEATGLVFDDELSPVQMRNLSELMTLKVLDRTMIILDIFAGRALSKEGKIQVEMAQLKYQYSRLTGFGEMLSRQGGGIGSKGPGEKKLELDKRHIKTRMEILKAELLEVEKHRHLIRSRRDKTNTPIVAIVGYTNAGKSTLLNALSGSDVYVKNQLFATLDPTTRAVVLPSGSEILLTDTVGFIRKLPHHLVKAFYSTLEEAKYADIILHVMDISSPHIMTHQKVVYETLEKLAIKDIPIIAVYNKIDQAGETYPKDETADYELEISAKHHIHCDQLLTLLEEIIYENMMPFHIGIPYDRQDIVTFCHNYGERIQEAYCNEEIELKGYLPKERYYKITPYKK